MRESEITSKLYSYSRRYEVTKGGLDLSESQQWKRMPITQRHKILTTPSRYMSFLLNSLEAYVDAATLTGGLLSPDISLVDHRPFLAGISTEILRALRVIGEKGNPFWKHGWPLRIQFNTPAPLTL